MKSFTMAIVMVMLVLCLTGCANMNAEQFDQTMTISRTALEAAKAGNVAGTLDVHLGGRVGAGMDTLWYLGNSENVLDANLQFRFTEPTTDAPEVAPVPADVETESKE